MMDCSQFRRSLLADPQDRSPELLAHRDSCHDCRQYTESVLRFESRIGRALRVDLPASDRVVVPLRGRARSGGSHFAYRKGWLAMAASALLAFVVAGALWLAVPGPSLAADVVTHMAGEPDAWRRTDVPVPDVSLLDVLHDSHLRLTANAGVVSYASSCAFRGHKVPHLVLQTDSGPVTVMVLVHDHVPKSVQFDEQGYRGVIVPVAGHGSVAVLARDQSTDMKTVESFANRVLQSIEWTG